MVGQNLDSTIVGSVIVHNQINNGRDVNIIFFFYVVLLCVFTGTGPCCDVLYDFHIKTMFCSSLPPVVCRRDHVLFTLCVLACVLWRALFVVGFFDFALCLM